MNTHHANNITWHTFASLDALEGLMHAMSTRVGGVSAAPLDSLDLGFGVGDEPANVVENRARFASAAGFALDDVVATRQVHETTVRVVTSSDRGTGATAPTADAWACDGLVTTAPNVVLMGFSADCPLVLLADDSARVAGLAHAGWRSAFGGILRNITDVMSDLGARRDRLRAGVAPAIGPCCYEVGGELMDALPMSDLERFFEPVGEKYLLDLPKVCEALLVDAGLRPEHIEVARTCTKCHPDAFYSYRASKGATGRHASVIALA